MPVNEITCSVCLEDVKLQAPPKPGTTVRCPHCRGSFRVPGEVADDEDIPVLTPANVPPRPTPVARPAVPPPRANARPPAKPAVKAAPRPKAPTPQPKPVPQAEFVILDDRDVAPKGRREPTPRKKGGGGCVIAGLVIAGLCFLVCGGGALAIVGVMMAGGQGTDVASQETGKSTSPSGKTETTSPKPPDPKDPPPNAPLEISAEEALRKATVVISAPLGKEGQEVVRTGFFAVELGVIVTTAKGLTGDVGLGPPTFDVVINPGQTSSRTVSAKRIATSPETGAMLLRVQRRGDQPLDVPSPLAFEAPPAVVVGQKLYAMCWAEAADGPFTSVPFEVASVKPGRASGTTEIQIKTTLPSTAAGAPVTDSRGRIVGLVPAVEPTQAWVTIVSGPPLPAALTTLAKNNPAPPPDVPAPPKPSTALSIPEVRKFEGHKGVINSMSLAKDGKTFVTGGDDKTLRLWDVETGKLVRASAEGEGHTGAIQGVALSPDGKWIASCGHTDKVLLFDAATCKQLKDNITMPPADKPPLGKVQAVTFTRDGHFLVAVDDLGTHLWEERNGPGMFAYAGGIVGGRRALTTLPEPRGILMGGLDLATWRLLPDRMPEPVVPAFPGDLRDVIVANTGDTVLSLHENLDHPLVLWDARTGKKLREFGHKDVGSLGLAFTWDDRQAVTADKDGNLRLWNVETGEEQGHWKGHDKSARVVRMLPDGQLLSAGDDGTIRLWNLPESKLVAAAPKPKPVPPPEMPVGELRKMQQHKGPVGALAFGPGGKLLITGSEDKTAQLWEAATGKPIRRLAHAGTVTGVAVSGDGGLVFTGGLEGARSTVHAWEVETGAPAQSPIFHAGGVSALALTRDGKYLASAGADQALRVWDARSAMLVRAFSHRVRFSAVALADAGDLAASAGDDKTVRLWNVNDGAELKKFGDLGNVYGLAFSPDGKLLAAGGTDKTVRLFDTVTGDEKQKFEGHADSVWCLDVSPDGKRLVTGSKDKTIRVWDVATGKELQMFEGHTDGVRCVRFSPDGTLIGSGSNDMTVRLWHLGVAN